VVSTKVLSPLQAVILAATMNSADAFLTTAVAKTIGSGIVDPVAITNAVLISALLSAILWNLITILMGLPVSSSHALVGGLIGAAVSHGGTSLLNIGGIMKILLSLLISPVFGIVCGYLFMKMILHFFGQLSPGVIGRHFGRLQIVSSSLMAFGHGSSDAQKSMGIITMALLASGKIQTLEVPTWVVFTCALAMGFGTLFGGWKIIKTLGHNMLKLEPVHGFAAETFIGRPHHGGKLFRSSREHHPRRFDCDPRRRRDQATLGGPLGDCRQNSDGMGAYPSALHCHGVGHPITSDVLPYRLDFSPVKDLTDSGW